MKNINEVIRGNDSVSLEFTSKEFKGNLTFVNNVFRLDKELYDVRGMRVNGLELFTDLIDTPNLYTGHIGEYVRVNNTGDGLIFVSGQDPSVGTVWGEITGTLSDQTDIQFALDNKEDSLGNPTENAQVLASTVAGNRYWTGAETLVDIPEDTDDLPEGSINKYYSDSLVNANTNVNANTLARHSHVNTSALNKIIDNGTGTKYLADDGIYRTVNVEGGTMVHNELSDRDASNAHPISAITNLQLYLDTIPSTTNDLTEGDQHLYFTDARVSANRDVLTNTQTRHSHANMTALGAVIDSGDGTKYLADDGSYKAVAAASATWGDILGTLSDQTDLQGELDNKLSLDTPEDILGNVTIKTLYPIVTIADTSTASTMLQTIRFEDGDSNNKGELFADLNKLGLKLPGYGSIEISTESNFPDNIFVTSPDGNTAYHLWHAGNFVPGNKEDDLGLPTTTGQLLTSDTSGNRSWVSLDANELTEDVVITKATTDNWSDVLTQIQNLPDNFGGYEVVIRLEDGDHPLNSTVFELVGKYNGRMRIEAVNAITPPSDSQLASISINSTGYFNFQNCFLNIDLSFLEFIIDPGASSMKVMFVITGNSIITTTGCYYNFSDADTAATAWFLAGVKLVSYQDTFTGSSYVDRFVQFKRGIEDANGALVEIFEPEASGTPLVDIAVDGIGLVAYKDAQSAFGPTKTAGGAIDIGASSTFATNVITLTEYFVDTPTDDSVILHYTSNRGGKIYYSLIDASASWTVPTHQGIIDGTGATAHGVTTVNADTRYDQLVTGLDSDINYACFAFASDDINNYSEKSMEYERTAAADTAPTATSVTISGTETEGETLTGSYTYNDAEGDTESGSTYAWYRADDNSGTNEAAISGATVLTYTLTSTDVGKYIRFGVTPANANATGTEAFSSYTGAIAAADTSAPTATWSPADGATDIAIDGNITITFNEAVRNTDGTEITDTNVDSLITLKETDASGTDVAFDATINAGKTVITVNPNADLSNSQQYYCAIAAVEDAAGNENSGSSVTFTTASGSLTQLTAPDIDEIRGGDTKIGIRYTDYNTSPASASLDVMYSVADADTWTTIHNIPAGSGIYQITGLSNGTAYDVKMVAVGDGTTTSNSDDSDVAENTSVSATPATPTWGTTNQDHMDTRLSRTFGDTLCSNNDGTGVLTPADFQIANFVSGGATAATIHKITDSQGNSITSPVIHMEIWFNYTGTPDGTETFDLEPASGAAVYNIAGVPMAATEHVSLSCVGVSAEQITDGDFPSGTTAWSFDTGFALGTDSADFDNTTNGAHIYQSDTNMVSSIEDLTTYILEFDISISSGNANMDIFAGNIDDELAAKTGYANGHHSINVSTPKYSHKGISFRGYTDSDNAWTITNISLKKI